MANLYKPGKETQGQYCNYLLPMEETTKQRKLTRKQKKFVASMVETGIGSVAAREAYDIPPENTKLAASIASENLAKPYIVKEIARGITPDMVDEAHSSLLTAVRLDYFVFGKHMTDEEITAHVEAQGLTCINIRPSEKGKLAFFSLPDGAARGKGIELYHKVQGTFAPEKKMHGHVHVHVEANPRIKDLAKRLNQ